MKCRFPARVPCRVVLLVLAVGCGGPKPKAPVSNEAPKNVEIGELPKLGTPIGPLDDGRIEAAPPVGWFTPLRDSRWVIRFQASEAATYPTILITAEDYKNIFNVSEENVDEFAEQISVALEADGVATRLSEDVRPVRIGTFHGITYGRRAKVKNRIVQRLFLETVVTGRKVSLELRARKGTLGKYRPHLHAVAEGIKFLKAETSEPPKQEPPEKEKDLEQQRASGPGNKAG